MSAAGTGSVANTLAHALQLVRAARLADRLGADHWIRQAAALESDTSDYRARWYALLAALARSAQGTS